MNEEKIHNMIRTREQEPFNEENNPHWSLEVMAQHLMAGLKPDNPEVVGRAIYDALTDISILCEYADNISKGIVGDVLYGEKLSNFTISRAMKVLGNPLDNKPGIKRGKYL